MARGKTIVLGLLPVDVINRTLGTELEAGEAILTVRAQDHIAEDHPEDRNLVMANLQAVITNPTYIGQSPHHGAAFELVRRVILPGTDKHVLAAVHLIPNASGSYSVHSAYVINQAKVDRRIARGRLFNAKNKGP